MDRVGWRKWEGGSGVEGVGEREWMEEVDGWGGMEGVGWREWNGV